MVESEELNEEVTSQFQNGSDEDVMFFDNLSKYSTFQQTSTEERLYVQTTHNIYTFKRGKKSRMYRIKDVSAIFKSTDNEGDVMLFFERSEDLHVSSKKREELIQMLQLRFINFNRNITLRIYNTTAAEIMGFHQTNTSKNKIAGIFDLPSEEQRDEGIEIKGEEEFNKEMLKTRAAGGAQMDDDIFDASLRAGGNKGDFAFDNGNHDSKAIDEEDLTDGRMTVLVGNRN